MSEATGVSTYCLYSIETGKTAAYYETLGAIAAAHELTVDQLVSPVGHCLVTGCEAGGAFALAAMTKKMIEK